MPGMVPEAGLFSCSLFWTVQYQADSSAGIDIYVTACVFQACLSLTRMNGLLLYPACIRDRVGSRDSLDVN